MKAAMLALANALAVGGFGGQMQYRASIRVPHRNWHDPEKVQKAQEKRARRAAKALKAAGGQ